MLGKILFGRNDLVCVSEPSSEYHGLLLKVKETFGGFHDEHTCQVVCLHATLWPAYDFRITQHIWNCSEIDQRDSVEGVTLIFHPTELTVLARSRFFSANGFQPHPWGVGQRAVGIMIDDTHPDILESPWSAKLVYGTVNACMTMFSKGGVIQYRHAEDLEGDSVRLTLDEDYAQGDNTATFRDQTVWHPPKETPRFFTKGERVRATDLPFSKDREGIVTGGWPEMGVVTMTDYMGREFYFCPGDLRHLPGPLDSGGPEVSAFDDEIIEPTKPACLMTV